MGVPIFTDEQISTIWADFSKLRVVENQSWNSNPRPGFLRISEQEDAHSRWLINDWILAWNMRWIHLLHTPNYTHWRWATVHWDYSRTESLWQNHCTRISRSGLCNCTNISFLCGLAKPICLPGLHFLICKHRRFHFTHNSVERTIGDKCKCCT